MHIDILRMLHRAGYTIEIAHRTVAGVKIELLAESNVKGTHPSSHRCGQRPLYSNKVLSEAV